MSRSLIVVLALAPFAIAACASSEAAPAPTTKAQAATSTGDYQSLCVEVMTRNRTCTDDYIPALVDSRARLDKPAGIAEAVKNDRAAVIAKAKEEWAQDSTDENLARHCQMMTEHMDDSMKSTADELRGCMAQQDCAAYVACSSPVFEKLMASGPAHH